MRDGIAEYMWEDYQNYIQDQDEEEEGETEIERMRNRCLNLRKINKCPSRGIAYRRSTTT